MSLNFCTGCGYPLAPNALYCTGCGAHTTPTPPIKAAHPSRSRLALKVAVVVGVLFLLAVGIIASSRNDTAAGEPTKSLDERQVEHVAAYGRPICTSLEGATIMPLFTEVLTRFPDNCAPYGGLITLNGKYTRGIGPFSTQFLEFSSFTHKSTGERFDPTRLTVMKCEVEMKNIMGRERKRAC